MNSQHKIQFAQFGIFIKALVYALSGIFMGLVALNIQMQRSNKRDTIEYLGSQRYGQILLSMVAIGLLGYVFWRFYQTFADHEYEGADSKGITKRLAYFSSGLIYGFIIYTIVKIIVNLRFTSGGKQSILSSLLEKDFSEIVVISIALILAIKACYQFYKAYSVSFREKLKISLLDANKLKILLYAGKIGFIARGIVIAILSYLFFKVAWNAQSPGNRLQAFESMQNQSNAFLLGIIALGLIIYAVFLFIHSGYRKIYID